MELDYVDINERGVQVNVRKKFLRFKLVDFDEVIDFAVLNDELLFGEVLDDNVSEDFEVLSDLFL